MGRPSDLRVTFDNAIAQRVGALLTLGDGPTWFSRHEIIELAANRRLPVLYDFSMFPAAEVGLMSYSRGRPIATVDAVQPLGLYLPARRRTVTSL